jgi:hypothetical protein
MADLKGISTWDELSIQIARLIKENEQLRKDKQELTTKLVNLELQMKQLEKRRERNSKVRISEME